jgi:hypothetical protein
MRPRRHHGALVAVTGLGLWMRLQGLSGLGLWRDDAWVALTARVRPSTAWRMGVTARGFTMAERAWILLHPSSPRWAEILPLVLGVAGIVAIYALARRFALSGWWSVGCAFVVAVSPVAVEWSSHVKQYSTDFLLGCLLLGLGEGARRRGGWRPVAKLGAASVVAFVVSASVVPAVVGTWGALLVIAFAEPARRLQIVLAGAVTTILCGAFAAAWLTRLPTSLSHYWRIMHRFIPTSSVSAFLQGVARAMRGLSAGIVHWPSHLDAIGAFLLVALVVIGALSARSALAPALTILVALVAASASLVPLGTGRTDEALYPALILLAAFGSRRIIEWARSASPVVRRSVQAAAVVAASLALFVVADGLAHPTRYPGVDVRAAAAQIDARRRPGDVVYVDATTRYPWVLSEQPHVALRFGPGWGTGFTVVSTQKGVVVSPTATWERSYSPESVAERVPATARVWFVGTGNLLADAPRNLDYQALRRRGWRQVWNLQLRGIYLSLLRPPPG